MVQPNPLSNVLAELMDFVKYFFCFNPFTSSDTPSGSYDVPTL